MWRPGASFWRIALTTLVIALSSSRIAGAHEVGVSNGRYEWRGDKVLVAVIFSQRELLAALPWLSQRRPAGPLAFEEKKERLGAWLLDGISMTAGERPCLGTFDGMRLDGDGVALASSFVCSADATEVRIEARFVSDLGRGHRHLASLETTDGSRDAVATTDSRWLSIRSGRDGEVDSPAIGFGRYVQMGVEHILTGYDHLLFLLGLVLLGRPIRSLVAAISAFTVAHSITLGLAAFDVWAPSTRIVEPLIALSIAYVGIENWFVYDARGRWRITFAFGLVHGFGFAGALRDIAVPRPRIPMALLGFNLGVEAGQIAVLALLLPLVLFARRLDLWQRAGMRACTGAVAAIGIVWFVVRLGGWT
jgi:hydrogenase/urease accessory protein HupE